MPRPILPPSAVAIYCYLQRHGDETGIATASRSQIAHAVGYSQVTARKALQRLEQHGLIEILPCVGRSGQSLPNILRLTDAEG